MSASKGIAVGAAGLGALAFGISEGLGVPASLIFLVLKLGAGHTTVVDWSWWAVFAPIWAGVAVGAAFWVVGFLAALAHIVRD